MQPTALPPLTEEQLHALVDGRVDGAEKAALEAQTQLDPQAQATVAQWSRQRTLLQDLYRGTLQESPPEHLVQAALQAGATRQTTRQAWRWGGIAASVALSFVVGWLAHGRLDAPAAMASKALRQPSTEFVYQASLAHAVYTPEVRHPVEVGTADQTHLVQWLSKRLGRPLKVPDLAPQGYELVGGRLLPGEAGARAQFMYQNTAGTRLTLYLGAVSGDNAGVNAKETAFRFSSEGPNASFYWVDHGFGYALTGPMAQPALMQLAQAVYQQL